MSESALKLKIQEDMKDAMRKGQKDRLGAIRLILTAIKQKEVDERIELEDGHILAILDKMLKERRDSIEQFKAAERDDLVIKESAEVAVIQAYLPTQLTATETDVLIKKTIEQAGASSMKDMGKVMAILKPLIQGRADSAAVSLAVKKFLE